MIECLLSLTSRQFAFAFSRFWTNDIFPFPTGHPLPRPFYGSFFPIFFVSPILDDRVVDPSCPGLLIPLYGRVFSCFVLRDLVLPILPLKDAPFSPASLADEFAFSINMHSAPLFFLFPFLRVVVPSCFFFTLFTFLNFLFVPLEVPFLVPLIFFLRPRSSPRVSPASPNPL